MSRSDERWPPVTEATISDLARSSSYDRGQSYYERGAVGEMVRRGKTVRADVEGSQYQPYTVTIEFDDAGVAGTECTCPYDHGGICKHRVAVLLTCLRDPERVDDRPPVSELIEGTSRESLEELLIELAENRPGIAEWIDLRLTSVDATASDTTVSVDIESVRKRANHALPKPGQRGHSDAYAEAERMASELDELIEQARQALDAGDGETAVEILEAVTEVLATNRWPGLLPRDVTKLYETLAALGKTFAEAILLVELSESEREQLEQRLTEWDEQIRHFTGRPTLAVGADAARDGWDDDRLQQALDGSLAAGELDIDEPEYVDGLTTVRLAALERQERTDKYLNLAKAAGKTQLYTEMLARKGEIQAAVDCAIENLSTPQSLLEIAKILRATGNSMAALDVAEHGLAVDGVRKDRLTEWLRDRAASLGEEDLALRAGIVAFEESPSPSTYGSVEELAGDEWESVRSELLASLREQHPTSQQAAEVFLEEDLYDEAIEVADRSGRFRVVETVVEKVTAHRPQWVIRTCKSNAEPIVEQGKHDSYETAVRWLRYAGEAAQEADELDEWHEYVETMREKHYRKYKLRPMLDDLLGEFRSPVDGEVSSDG
ncbi:SWIM zinc finger family protein [Natrarchaeobius oligotrophus]|nr:SWIM zinc finger family protein [Natrarchaeobius chitinivorans]